MRRDLSPSIAAGAGGGLAVRNLCRERLSDDELATCCPFGDWDRCYIGVLAGIAAMPVRTQVPGQVPVSRRQLRQLQFSFIEPR
jgi:hypothetical protein